MDLQLLGAGEETWKPVVTLRTLALSDAGGTEKPFHRARGGRFEAIAGVDVARVDYGFTILAAALGQDGDFSKQSTGGLYAGQFWYGSPYVSHPHPMEGRSFPFFRAGYQPMQSDPLGLLYDLRAPAVILGAQWRSRLGPVLGFQFSALDLSDADPYFRNRARTGQARFYGVELFFYRKGLSLELSYGNFRINGQSARSDGRIQELVLWDGQNAIPAQYVHYSGLGLQWRSQDVRLDFQAYGSHGQQSARTAFGGEEFLSRKTIRGWMVGGRFLWRIFEDSEIGFAGLGSSRQRKDADDFHGFGALNPRPRLLGGLGSILLYARPPFDQSHPMSNMRFYDGFPSDHYSQNSRNVDSGQMRRDMVIPDHGNRGIRMAGIQWSTELSYPRFLDLGWNELAIHLNRAEFKDAQGTEAVAILHYDLGFLEFTLSAAGAYITPAAESPNPYTGLIPSSKRRFFSRYGFAFSAKY